MRRTALAVILGALMGAPTGLLADSNSDSETASDTRTLEVSGPISDASHLWYGWRRVRSEEEEAVREPRPPRRTQLVRPGEIADMFQFAGDVVVRHGDRVNGDVFTAWGDVRVEGEVKGSVVATFGDVVLGPDARVSGDCVSVGGEVYREPGATVGGELVETGWRGLRVTNGGDPRPWNSVVHVDTDDGDWDLLVRDRSPGRLSYERREIWSESVDNPWDSRHGLARGRLAFQNLRYNRVDGLFLGLGFDSHERGGGGVRIHGQGGYGLKSERWQWQAGLERGWFAPPRRLALGIRVYDFTDTEDGWVLPPDENSLAAFLTHHDFYDYYRRDGLTASVTQRLGRGLLAGVEYRTERHRSAISGSSSLNTDWSLFNQGASFRANPVADEGDLEAAALLLSLDTRDRITRRTRRGWLAFAELERAGRNGLGGDFEYDRAVAELRRFQPLGRHDAVNLRIRAASVSGDAVPVQKRFDLGGVGTLRGYSYKAFQDADRMVFGTLEYAVVAGGRDWDWDGDWFLDELSLSVFGDAGLAWNAPAGAGVTEGFDTLTMDALKTNVGIGVGDAEGEWRVDFARRVDRRDSPIRVSFRIRRPF